MWLCGWRVVVFAYQASDRNTDVSCISHSSFFWLLVGSNECILTDKSQPSSVRLNGKAQGGVERLGHKHVGRLAGM
jgi:hypothetical protein